MSKITFETLKEAFCNKDCPTNINIIRQLLYDFSYTNLSDEKSNYENADVKSIRIGIFNFLYSGDFNGQLNKETKNSFKEIIENYLIDQLKDVQESNKEDKAETIIEIKNKLNKLPTWDEFYEGFEKNWEELIKCHSNYLENIEKTIRHIIVYEAPPPCQSEEKIKEKYFLISNNGAYATTIKKTFNADEKVHVSKFMSKKNIGYFDLIMAPMPLSSDLRKKWSTENKWQIDGKQLPVILFELGIAHLILKNKNIENPTFAIGTPALTSTSIFEYYSDKLLKVWIKKNEKKSVCNIIFGDAENNHLNNHKLLFTSNLSITNSQTTHKIRGEQGRGIIYPLFKSNVISGSNYLSELLMKNAFDKY